MTQTTATLAAHNLKKSYKSIPWSRTFPASLRRSRWPAGPTGPVRPPASTVVGLVTAMPARSISTPPASRKAMHAREQGLSYLPQEASVFRKLNVEENILAVLELQDLSKAEQQSQLENLLEELHIGHIRHINAAALSGGDRRRVEIARALATRPRFILLDEPFAGVDPIAVLEIQKIIRFLKERGIGVLITDHNVRETLGICDHAVIINAGHVLASGTPADIVANESVRQVYLGEHFRL